MPNERSLQNLKPFKPGKSGNPNGRPKGALNSSTRLLRILEVVQKKQNEVTEEEGEYTIAELMDIAIVAKALAGDVTAYREIMDRFEGKAKQSVEVSTPPDNVIEIEFIPPKKY